ncbi:hypothetical protein [Frigoribacterium sp. SL97]|jgi:hypothetical protein|uniref:hypothetical protein n=1 Tax=Frigoribacterium sp. SL97 TaxID=2994664 RepID=UPI00226D6B8C|nr:hypothetical protein [Frigoribacterium sp. SL97]WAC50289.1 hypothetical protein OVA02_10340 [Frigoribacterium sp. SL97]
MDLTPHHFNPAGRLFEFLRHSKQQSRVGVAATWSGYLGVDEYSVDFFAGVSEVLALPDHARDAFASLPSRVKQYLDEDDLEGALTQASTALDQGTRMLHGAVDEFTRLYGDDAVTEIKGLSNFLRGEFQGRDGDAAAIEAATDTFTTVRDLADELVKALDDDDDLAPDLRLLLLNQALAFRQAVSLSRAGGIEAVGLERDRAVGLIVAHPTVAAELRRKPKLRIKLLALIAAAGVVASAFNSVIESAEKVDHLVGIVMAEPDDPKAVTDLPPSSEEGAAPSAPAAPTP